jgi:tetratricopeptide (TPR) repeat protein
LGRLAFESGDYHLAASVLQQTLPNQPNNGSLLFDYAQATYSIGKVADAQAAFQNALALNSLPPAQATLARRNLDFMALAANPAGAAAAASRIDGVLKSEPDDVPALMAQAAASESKADGTKAEQCYEQVLARRPDFTPAQEQLARLYTAEPTKLDRAYALASKAHEELPDDPQAAKILGIILVQRSDFGHAANMLQQSVLKLNTDAEAYYFLGSAQFHLKNRTESKASLQQALALKLSGPLADSARQMLAQLK